MKVLVIKLAALGDVVQAFGPFAAIRAHHPGAHVTLLTTPPYAALLDGAPWFDALRADGRPAWGDVPAVARLAWWLRRSRFDRVYDLQTSSRSSRYRWFVGGRAEWSGIAPGASHPHANPARDAMHTLERQREQLAMAGITRFPDPELSWLTADLSRLNLPERFALLVPGASPLRPGKRWPAQRFAELAARLDMPAVAVGGPADPAIPGVLDLRGRTTLRELAALARRAALCVGNDTGPTHLAAALGVPTLAVFGPESDPALCAPRGPRAAWLHGAPIGAVTAGQVLAALP
ncbi:glycosyltransferase family 9 protein [Roseococcus sp. DSY-14]|uniref:glycosyltransferase family 9 protein n=1 Tax=Roseococcus sp. DSY-14 TaxID=3369650 RepID=UPI00387A8DAE